MQLEAQLADREFLPAIERITSVSGSSEPCEWSVETDRGPTQLMLKSEDDVCPLDDHRALVTDANGIRYLIPDVRQLDATSRRLLERRVFNQAACRSSSGLSGRLGLRRGRSST